MRRGSKVRGSKCDNKEPWLSANLSLLLPGCGQLYVGRYVAGIIIAFVEGTFFIVGVWQFIHPKGNTLGGEMLIAAFVLGYGANVVHAHRAAILGNREEFEVSRKTRKDPWLAVFLGQLLPGLGHVYLGKWFFGAFFLMAVVAKVTLVRNSGLVDVLYSILIYGVVSYHAYFLAPVRREPTSRTIWMFILGLAFIEALSHVPASLLGRNIEQSEVSGSSMAPLLQSGDQVLVARVAPKEIKRGDVVVFTRTGNPTEQWAKRVLAVGGESVDIREGQVYVSGRLLDDISFRNIKSLDEMNYVSRGQAIHVQEGFLFVVGDNPARSVDSRHFGPISIANVIGIPYKIFWPIDRIRIIQPMAEQIANTW